MVPDNNDETGLNNTLLRYAYYQTLSGLFEICVKVLECWEIRSIPYYTYGTNIVLCCLHHQQEAGRKEVKIRKKKSFPLVLVLKRNGQ